MIRISRWEHVKLRNFGCYSSLDLDLPPNGLLLLTGKNLMDPGTRSNASGKSTLFEALLYVLTGKMYKFGGKIITDEAVRWGESGCLVEARFATTGGGTLVVTRTYKYKGSTNLVLSMDNKPIAGKDRKDTQRMLTSMVGMDFDGLVSVMLRPQGAIEDFVGTTDAGRKGILERILRLEVFNDARRMALSSLRALEQKLKEYDIKINSINNEIKSRKVIAQNSYDNFCKMQDWLDQTALSRADSLAALEEEIVQHEARVVELNELIEADAKELEKVSEFDSTINKLTKKVTRVKGKLSDLTATITFHNKELVRLSESRLAYVQCPTCLQEVTEECREHYKAEIDKKKKELYINKEAALQQHSIEANKLKNFSRELDSLLEQRRSCRDVQWRMAASEKEKAKAQTFIRLKQVDLANISSKLREVLHNQGLPYEEKEDEDTTELEERLEQAELNRAKAADLAKSVEFWNSTGFSNSGVKAYVMRSVADEITELSNDYYSMLSFAPITIRLSPTRLNKSSVEKESMTIILSTPDREVDYRSYSGGEKKKVTIAVLLALVEFGLRYAATSFRLAFFDEVFDGLDTASAETVMVALRELQQRIGLVIVISNNDNLVDMCGTVWVATKDSKGKAAIVPLAD